MLPLVPDRGFGPHEALNPFTVWRLVVIVMAINGLGYVALRVLGPQRGLPFAGFIGRFVSSAATVGAMGSRARGRADGADARGRRRGPVDRRDDHPHRARPRRGQPADAVGRSLPALVPAGIAAVAYAGVTLAHAARAPVEGPLELGRAFDLRTPLVLALTVSAVRVAAEVLNEQLGSSGVVLAAAVAGFADAQSAAVSAASLVASGRLEADAAIVPILAGLTTNTITKAVLAAALGGRRYARRVVVGLVLVLAAAWAGGALAS